MVIDKLSAKQKQILLFGFNKKMREQYDNIICDGAVRSGKTMPMTIGFIFWAMRWFNGVNFAICSKTVGAAERNVIMPLMENDTVRQLYEIDYTRSTCSMTVSDGGVQNRFYIFGGTDERSYTKIQGVTLCGVLFDEVALMPRSFVEQAIARTASVEGAKLWFNCNPESPEHWFYKEWILDADGENKKRSLHMHFLMQDNPIMTHDKIKRAENQYDGVFYLRYILGLWVLAEGVIYPMFNDGCKIDSKEITTFYDNDYKKRLPTSGKRYISIDYGTKNPCSMGVWFVPDDISLPVVREREYYYDSKRHKVQLTDEEYYSALVELAGDDDIEQIIIDPSAASFIATIRKKGKFNVRKADNDVISGIRFTATAIKNGIIKIDKSCEDIIREFSAYVWDDKAAEDKPVKENDHAMDDMRYFCYTVLRFDRRFVKKLNAPSNYVGGIFEETGESYL